MRETLIKLYTVGRIIEGENPGWYIYIVDKREEAKNDRLQTGGIFIYHSNTITFCGKDCVVYDDWVQDMKGLEVFFSEPKWVIEWLDVKKPEGLILLSYLSTL